MARRPTRHTISSGAAQAGLLGSGSGAFLLAAVLDRALVAQGAGALMLRQPLEFYPWVLAPAAFLLLYASAAASLAGGPWANRRAPIAQGVIAASAIALLLFPEVWWELLMAESLLPGSDRAWSAIHLRALAALAALNLVAACRAMLLPGSMRLRPRSDPRQWLAILIGGTLGGLWDGVAVRLCS